MPDIDPITREALRRASQMRTHTHRNAPEKPLEKPKEQPVHTQKSEKQKTQPLDFTSAFSGDPIKAFFKDKEESIILLLVLLLMEEKTDPSLLLALMYLLI